MPHELDQRFPHIKLFGGKLKKALQTKFVHLVACAVTPLWIVWQLLAVVAHHTYLFPDCCFVV